MEKIERTFVIEKETPGTFRYQEAFEGEVKAIGTLYVKKWALGTPVPERLKVTVEEAV